MVSSVVETGHYVTNDFETQTKAQQMQEILPTLAQHMTEEDITMWCSFFK